MYDGMRMATEGMLQMSARQDLVTNNLANVGVVGFRKESLVIESFSDVMNREMTGQSEVTGGGGTENRGGVRHYSMTHTGQGALKESGDPFDMALDDNGKGYFALQGPQGEMRFTRGGNFKLHSSGHLVTSDGAFVMGQRGPIKCNGSDFKVKDDGTVMVDNKAVDKLLICVIDDPKAIDRQSGASFTVNNKDAVKASPDFKVRQGYTEQANFNALTEMVELMQTMRNFEANQKVLQSHDQRLQKTVNELGRVR